MLHSIPENRHGPLSDVMSRAVSTCVHCGFCLAACPTYRELEQEMDTPRGRIVLMKQVLESATSWQAAQPHIDRCLGCLACEPVCPSGVQYRELISPFRALAQSQVRVSRGEKCRRALVMGVLARPALFRILAHAGNVAKLFDPLIPGGIKPMLDFLPVEIPRQVSWPALTPAQGKRRARVGLLIGCAQQVLAPEINSATIAVLARNGVEVLIPQAQGCCGGLAWHTGDLLRAQAQALRNLAVFPKDLDAIITNAAGCGSAMHEYHLMLRGTEYESEADQIRKRVLDVSVFLDRLGFSEKPLGPLEPCRVTYHDACHLANAQGVRNEPRSLLRQVPNVTLVELADAHLCCGSAGTYNLDQPTIARSLGENKAREIQKSQGDIVATGNIGCMMQLRHHLSSLKLAIPVWHTMQILEASYHRPKRLEKNFASAV